MRTPVRIVLARHGETVFNVERRWQGQSDSPLTERGVAQARELASALSEEPIAAVYSSDLGRAIQTAREVALAHELSVVSDARLREIDVGEWAGLSHPEITERYGDLPHRWEREPATLRLPGGETIAEAQTRALSFFAERMRVHAEQTVVVITHGAVGQAILVAAMGRTVADLWLKERLDNCQISRLEWTADGGLRR